MPPSLTCLILIILAALFTLLILSACKVGSNYDDLHHPNEP